MTLATYNVHHCEGTDGVVDVVRICRTITDIAPDVIALQELDQGWTRSEGADQPAEIERLTGLNVAFFPTFKRGTARYGFALAARSEFEAHFRSLPTPEGEEPRGIALADFADFSVLVTHLSTRRQTRRAQKAAVGDLVRGVMVKSPGRPLFLLGDLNHRPRRWGVLRRTGLVGGRATPTFPSTRPRRCIDHVLVAPGAQLRAQSAPPSSGSDHLPLAAEVVLRP